MLQKGKMLTFKPTTLDYFLGQTINGLGVCLGYLIGTFLYHPNDFLGSTAFLIRGIPILFVVYEFMSLLIMKRMKNLTSIVVDDKFIEGPSGLTLFSKRARLDLAQITAIQDKFPRWVWPPKIVAGSEKIYLYHHLSNKSTKQILSIIRERKS